MLIEATNHEITKKIIDFRPEDGYQYDAVHDCIEHIEAQNDSFTVDVVIDELKFHQYTEAITVEEYNKRYKTNIKGFKADGVGLADLLNPMLDYPLPYDYHEYLGHGKNQMILKTERINEFYRIIE